MVSLNNGLIKPLLNHWSGRLTIGLVGWPAMIKPRGIPSPTSAWQPPSGACVSGAEELEMGGWWSSWWFQPMYSIFSYIYHQNQANINWYTIHGLVGGFKYFLKFSPWNLGKWSKLTSNFFKWVGSTTNQWWSSWICFCWVIVFFSDCTMANHYENHHHLGYCTSSIFGTCFQASYICKSKSWGTWHPDIPMTDSDHFGKLPIKLRESMGNGWFLVGKYCM